MFDYKKILIILVVLAFTITGCGEKTSTIDTSSATKVKSITTIKEKGGRVDWSHENNLILFDKLGKDLYYDVYMMNPDGSEEKCLTCDRPELPQKHNGGPTWHPSGDWIVFQSVNPTMINKDLPERFVRMNSNPGAGAYNDLWIMDRHGNKLVKLLGIPEGSGTLHPHFSHDGTKLTWSQLVKGPDTQEFLAGDMGQWALKVADFSIVNGYPRMQNVQTFQQGPLHRFYESHGFTKDDKKIIFSGNPEEKQATRGFDIYTLELATQKYTKLTDQPNEWNEHANLSPDGQKLIWMSSKDTNTPDLMQVKADYWLMDIDGSNKQRLTYFNEPGHEHYLDIDGGIVGADSSWSPDGQQVMIYIKTEREDRDGPIMMMEFE